MKLIYKYKRKRKVIRSYNYNNIELNDMEKK